MGVVYLAYCGSWQLYLVSVLFISSIPHLTLHQSSSFFQHVFVLVYYIFFKARVHVCACVCACMHMCVYVSSSKFKLI